MSDSNVIGVVLIIRHGDRQGFYQDPVTYDATATELTPLGNQQEFQLGQELRSIYLNSSSPSFIQGISTDLFQTTQVQVRADAGGEGDVIMDSSMSLVQGLWPATPAYNITLANGSNIEGPLGGYQYVKIESVEPDLDVSLEGFTDCNTFDDNTNAFYNSSAFLQKAKDSATFLSQLPPFLDGRPVTLENMWNIYDYMNVQSIHNATFANRLPPTFLAQARDLANFHEYGVFSSPELTGIGNIAGQTILPSMLSGFSRIASSSDPLKFLYEATAYKPLLSLFNMTGLAEMNPQLASIVNYAAALAFEVRQPSSGGEVVLRLNFKNGTDDEFHTYNFLGTQGDVPLSKFVSTLAPAAINTTAEWCTVCANNQDRGCDALALATTQGRESVHDRISPVGAGFLGAGLTIAVIIIMLAVAAFLGMLTIRGRKKHIKSETDSTDKA